MSQTFDGCYGSSIKNEVLDELLVLAEYEYSSYSFFAGSSKMLKRY